MVGGDDHLVDLFAGAGGSGGGLLDAADMLGRRVRGTFVNHWDRAIAIHSANHPEHRHLEEDLFKLDPAAVFPPDTRCSLLWASPQCFTAGAVITTARGMIPIEKVQAGDRVLTHKGRWRRVVAAACRTVGETVVLKGHGHPGLETTAEHPFYSKRITSRYPGKGESGRRPGRKRTLVENPFWSEAKGMAGKLWAIPRAAEALPMPMDHDMIPDRALFYSIGRWLGDGSVNKGDAVISCGKHEAGRLNKILNEEKHARRGDGSGCVWRHQDGDTADTFSLGNAAFARFLVREFGSGASGKNIPGWCLGLPEEWKAALIEGYLGADGHAGNPRSSCCSVSRALAAGVKMLLAGRRSVSHYFGPNDRGEIDGRKIEGQDIHSLTWAEGNSRQTSFTDTNHRFQFCKEVETRSHKGGVEVYNLQVDEDESYVVDGIVVHNCTFFSVARGAACVNEQDRSHALHLEDWVRHLRPEAVICENVKEFRDWGPVVQKRNRSGELMWALRAKPVRRLPPGFARRRKEGETEGAWSTRMRAAGYAPYDVPDKSRRGEYFDAWLTKMEGMGYESDCRVLRSADYGDPTIRSRLFIYLVRRDTGRRIVWPEPFAGDAGKNPERPMRWRTARDSVIDWSLEGESVFTRDKRLVDNTFRRLAIGLVKYGLRDFLSGEFLVPNFGEAPGQMPRSHAVDAPLPTVTSHGAGGVVAARGHYLLPKDAGHAGDNVRPDDRPVSGLTTKPHEVLVGAEAYLVPRNRGPSGDRVRGVDDPIPTLTTNHRGEGVARPYVVQMKGASVAQSVDGPVTAVTSSASHYLSSPMLDHIRGQGVCGSVDAPLRSSTAGGSHQAIAEAFLEAISSSPTGERGVVMELGELSEKFLASAMGKGVDASRATTFLGYLIAELHRTGRVDAKPWIYVYYSSGAEGKGVDSPLPTVRTKAGHALVYPVVELDGRLIRIDLIYRMLTPSELQRAMGFPDDTDWAGSTNTDIIRAIGNSVSRGVATALGLAWYSQDPDVWQHMKKLYGHA